MATMNVFGKSRLEVQCEAIEKELLVALDEKSPTELADWTMLQLYWALAELRKGDQEARARVRRSVH